MKNKGKIKTSGEMGRVVSNGLSHLLASTAVSSQFSETWLSHKSWRVKAFQGLVAGEAPQPAPVLPSALSVGSWPKVLSAHQVREKLRLRLDIFVWFGTGRNALSLGLCLLLVFYCKLQCLLPQRDILFSKKSWKQSKRYLFFVNKITSN